MINGTVINGAAINGQTAVGIGQATSLRPVRFGVPTSRASLRPVHFGVPRLGGMSATTLAPVHFGVPTLSQRFRARSLQPVRFGDGGVVRGMPPPSVVCQAESLRAGVFGRPSLHAQLHAGPAESLTPVRFGVPALVLTAAAASLRPVHFGVPGMTMVAHASSLRSVRFGVPAVSQRMQARSLRSTRFGRPHLVLGGLELVATSLAPVRFGVPSLGGMAFQARPLYPVRFGVPALDRGTTC